MDAWQLMTSKNWGNISQISDKEFIFYSDIHCDIGICNCHIQTRCVGEKTTLDIKIENLGLESAVKFHWNCGHIR